MKILFLIGLAFTAPLTAAAVSASEQPNIVFILADDQGWNALSVKMDPNEPGSGSTYYHTPRLEELAVAGMRFSRAYSPAPTCSPTRHAIQFGRSPTSLGIFGADDIRDWNADNRESLAHRLKSVHSNYVCAHFGKWHIGRSPEALGYDVSDGNTSNANGNSENPQDPKRIFDLTNRSLEFMQKQVRAGKPFFLQISHYADHLQFQALQETIRKYETEYAKLATPYQNSPLWAAMNENLDTGVGRVLNKIEELGIKSNTYVIYTADNGYESKQDFGKSVAHRGYYKAYPQRSHKYHLSEGGIRVPFILFGPGIPANSHSSVPVVGTDIFATILDIAGGLNRMPGDVEAASLLSHAKSGGRLPIERRDPFLVFKFSKPDLTHDAAIVQDDYKLIKDMDTGEIFLFNLSDDIGERNDLTREKPEFAEQLHAHMTAYFKRFGWDESQIVPANTRQNLDQRRRAGNSSIAFSGSPQSLQTTLNEAPAGSTVVCDRSSQLEISQSILIDKPLTLVGLNARLPDGLGKTPLIIVKSENVGLLELELHGNHDSVSQDVRAPLISISQGSFRVERCAFYDSSKDGIEVQVPQGGKDIVGGTIKDIKAFRLGRDAVSISGGVEGRKVRNLIVENVSMVTGYLRGAVEVSDGTDNIRVSNVYAKDCVYAIDVQDHRKECAANTNVSVENVMAVDCRHIIRTANSSRGHAQLAMRNFTGSNCERPVLLTNTQSITLDNLMIVGHKSSENPPIELQNCQDVRITNAQIESEHYVNRAISMKDCSHVQFSGLATMSP